MARPEFSTALEVAPAVSGKPSLNHKIKDLDWFGAGEAVFKGGIRDPGFFPPRNDMEAQREWLGGFGAAWAEAPDDEGRGESVDEALARALAVVVRNHNPPGPQTSPRQDHISCNYPAFPAHIICNWDQIICNQPANNGPDPH